MPFRMDRSDCRGSSFAETRESICRLSPEDAGYREVFVSIDGERVAIMQFGESCTFDVKPGPHEIRAHNTLFWKTHHVVLRPGEHASALPDLRARERRRRY